MNILQAINDPKVFAPSFRSNTWKPWIAFLCALFALPMTPEQLALFQKHTGRTTPPTEPLHEAWLCIGRRGGKSFILAVIAVFLACFHDWRQYLGPGEVATIMIIARDRRQARVIKRFITGLLHDVPMLRSIIEDESAETISLKNRVSIEIHTASFRSTRGYTIIAALLDEIAYWPTDDAAEPDVEVIGAIRPGMATVPGAMLLCASSPHARKGALWNAHRKHFGKDGDDVLVWQAATRDMNAVVPQSYIDRHMADDPARAAAEYGAQFRLDVESYIAREVVDACTVFGRRELPRIEGVRYTAFCDPSGGSKNSMTLVICHVEGNRAIEDAIRERRPPFSPDDVVAEFCALLKAYGVSTVRGDRYAGEWPRERFQVHGVTYIVAPKPKSDIYRDLLPVLNGRRVELLDHLKTVNQLLGLERQTARGGKDSIDHARDQHDDLANALAGAVTTALAATVREMVFVPPPVWSANRGWNDTAAPAPAPAPAPASPAPAAPQRQAAEQIKASMTRPRNEPWRPYVSPNGISTPLSIRASSWSPPKGW